MQFLIFQELYVYIAAFTTRLREMVNRKISLLLLEKIEVDLHELIGISSGVFINLVLAYMCRGYLRLRLWENQ